TLAHNWANPAATKRSFELFAQEVMPHFKSSGSNLQVHADRAQAARAGLAEKQMQAVAEATERYEQELALAA
ncbi:MAG: LLM class flavin-dependent oxidoreductase, partial [Chloroflexota bacterium]